MKNKFPKTKNILDKIFTKEEKTPYELILCKCFDCCAYNPLCCKNLTTDDFKEAVNSIKYCESGSCVLAGYATGKKTFPKKERKKREYTEEQKAAMKERMIFAREAKMKKIV